MQNTHISIETVVLPLGEAMKEIGFAVKIDFNPKQIMGESTVQAAQIEHQDFEKRHIH